MHLPLVKLCNEIAILEPLTEAHVASLIRLGLSHTEVLRHLPYRLDTAAAFREKLEGGLRLQAAGALVLFATRDARTGELAGSTSIRNIEADPACVEIGGTWIVPPHQRTGLNRAAKSLQLEWLFEKLPTERVEFKTDVRNLQSQTALARFGARFEGIRYAHMRRADGSLRDSVYFSVVKREWPALRASLLARQHAYAAGHHPPVPVNAA